MPTDCRGSQSSENPGPRDMIGLGRWIPGRLISGPASFREGTVRACPDLRVSHCREAVPATISARTRVTTWTQLSQLLVLHSRPFAPFAPFALIFSHLPSYLQASNRRTSGKGGCPCVVFYPCQARGRVGILAFKLRRFTWLLLAKLGAKAEGGNTIRPAEET